MSCCIYAGGLCRHFWRSAVLRSMKKGIRLLRKTCLSHVGGYTQVTEKGERTMAAEWDDPQDILTPLQRRRLEQEPRDRRGSCRADCLPAHRPLPDGIALQDPGDEVREWERQQGAVAL